VNKEIDNIKTYQVKLKTRIYPPDISGVNRTESNAVDITKYVESKSKVFGVTAKKISIETTTIPPDMELETVSRLINNGIWLWVEIKVKKLPKLQIDKPKSTAIKIKVSEVSPDPENEPFNTIYGQSGTGIFQYTDFPGTLKVLVQDYSFDDIVKSKNSQEIIFSGTREIDLESLKKDEPDQEIKHYINQSTQFCRLWVSRNTGLIMAYLIGKSAENPTMRTEIEYISINEDLTDDIFIYDPPSGVVVRDVTDAVLKAAKKDK
jgi:hypothetical protein